MPKDFSIIDELPVPLELVERRIYLVRGQKVMFDFDLAELYQVSTKRLNEAVKRNRARFPEDFMFQLNKQELKNWISQIAMSNTETVAYNRSQFATGSQRHRDPRFSPYVFTELGVAMLSSVLNSELAIKMNIIIMRAFVNLRRILSSHKELASKIEHLERSQKEQGIVLALVAGDIKGLRKKIIKDFKKLKTPRRSKIKIGFRID